MSRVKSNREAAANEIGKIICEHLGPEVGAVYTLGGGFYTAPADIQLKLLGYADRVIAAAGDQKESPDGNSMGDA